MTSTTEPRRPGQRRIASAAAALAAGLTGYASAPTSGPVPPVNDITPGARTADGRLVSRCLRIGGSDCLAPAP